MWQYDVHFPHGIVHKVTWKIVGVAFDVEVIDMALLTWHWHGLIC